MILSPVLSVYKPVSMTPLEAIRRYQEQHPEYKKLKLGYAGRLDPMAEGVLLILVGEENKKRKHYEQLSKQYEFDVLFGIATDSYDLLGLITEEKATTTIDALQQRLAQILSRFLGTREQQYPPYSSKPVQGKPLYWWTREKRLSEVEIPTKQITVHALTLSQATVLSAPALQQITIPTIQRVTGAFRQQEILDRWRCYFQEKKVEQYPVIRFTAHVSSGTYIRELSHDMGQILRLPTTVIRLVRTQVGAYDHVTAERVQ